MVARKGISLPKWEFTKKDRPPPKKKTKISNMSNLVREIRGPAAIRGCAGGEGEKTVGSAKEETYLKVEKNVLLAFQTTIMIHV